MFFGAERTFTKDAGPTSNYQFKKYMEPSSYANPIPLHVNPNGDNGTTDMNVPLMRFAEVLLIKENGSFAKKLRWLYLSLIPEVDMFSLKLGQLNVPQF